MPTVYSSTNAQWPLLQSKREQKFKNGLLAVSAEFIAPADTPISLEILESSEGDCTVYPSPVESYDNSPFKKISATAYKIFSVTTDENISQTFADITFSVDFAEWARDERGRKLFPLSRSFRSASKKIKILSEIGTVKNLTDETTPENERVPFLSRQLEIIQNKKSWMASEIFNFIRPYNQSPDTLKSPVATEFISSLSSQMYTPNIIEYSATYSVEYTLNFGEFVEPEPLA
jgi:hypothetical protein